MLHTLYGYLSRLYFFYFVLFLFIVSGVIGLFETLDFVQKYLAKTTSDPMIVFWRTTRHVHQFFPYLLFAVFAYTVRMIIQNHEFLTLQYLGFSPMVWVKTSILIVAGLFLAFYFVFTPIQRLAFDRSFKPDNALNSILLAPTGIWFLHNSSQQTKQFIKARSYDKKNQTLKDVCLLEVSQNSPPKFITKDIIKDHIPQNYSPAKQDYLPYINTEEKMETLTRMGFSTTEYGLIRHKIWFLPLYWAGLAALGYLLAYTITSNIYFFLGLFGTAIALFFAYEMVMSFVSAEKLAILPALLGVLIALYCLCGGYYVVTVRHSPF